jgi:hypothetical protein
MRGRCTFTLFNMPALSFRGGSKMGWMNWSRGSGRISTAPLTFES